MGFYTFVTLFFIGDVRFPQRLRLITTLSLMLIKISVLTSLQIFRNKLGDSVKPRRDDVCTAPTVSEARGSVVRQDACGWSRTSESSSELMCKPSKLLSLWINVSIIFSAQINGSRRMGCEWQKKKKKRDDMQTHLPMFRLHSIICMRQDCPGPDR